MKSNTYKTSLLMIALLLSGATVHADALDFEFDPVVVTALRQHSKSLETPADVTVLTHDRLQTSGASNLVEALQFIEGIEISSQGPEGQSVGRMSSEVVIRGAKKGALVLIDGVPINQNGFAQLDAIPLNEIERIEIVKGAGSVRYGSDAFGGVINIITKQQFLNTISVAGGSRDNRNGYFSMQPGKLGFAVFYNKQGEFDHSCSNAPYPTPVNGHYVPFYYDFLGNEDKGVTLTYRFNNQLSLFYQHSLADIDRRQMQDSGTPTALQLLHDSDRKDLVRLTYRHHSWETNIYGNFRNLRYNSYLLWAPPLYEDNVHNKTATLGIDSQYAWKTGTTSWLSGISMQKERYEKADSGIWNPGSWGPYHRSQYALFTQLTEPTGKASKLTLGLRQQWIEREQGQTNNQLCPQLQWVATVDSTRSWFVNIGKSFRIPTFTELYGGAFDFLANPALKPETGWTYESGWRKVDGDGQLKVTLFVMKFRDHIDYQQVANQFQYTNFPLFENRGLEVNYERKWNNFWTYSVGGSFAEPRVQTVSGTYQNIYNKLQFDASVRYHKGPWTGTLTAGYLGRRANQANPSLPVNVLVRYRTESGDDVQLTVKNLFNRRDVLNSDDANWYFYSVPRTFQLGYDHHF